MPKKTNEQVEKVAKKRSKVSNNVNANDITSKKTTKSTKSKTSKTTATTKSSKSTTSKKTTAKSAKKTTSRKKTVQESSASVLEYYDLPYRYNQTIVKILAQTPNMLFVYWDISDTDRDNFKLYYGDNFFDVTKPVLIVHNKTMNYSFEIEINDFANSWYLHVNDANCKYAIELGRRPFVHVPSIQEDYIHISSSNKIDAPNNHILFEKFNPNVEYKNVKNNNILTKDFSNLSSFKNMQKIYCIYDLYKEIYKDDLFNEIRNNDVSNPSFGLTSSFK